MRRTAPFGSVGQSPKPKCFPNDAKYRNPELSQSSFDILELVLQTFVRSIAELLSTFKFDLDADRLSKIQNATIEAALTKFNAQEAVLKADIATLISQRDCDQRNIEQLFAQVESLTHRTESIEGQMVVNGTNSTQIQNDVETLKSSISKVLMPGTVGDCKVTQTIHTTVPRLSPLSEGIIGYLTKVSGGNVCDCQRVEAFSDSVYDSSRLPRNAADLSTDSEFHSHDTANQSFGYDFKDNQLISPTHYTIRTYPRCGVGYDHMKSWVIEVTNDRSITDSWIEIDRRENNQDLNGKGFVQIFQCSNTQNGEFRYIRLRQIGPNHHGQHFMIIAAFEVFGQLRVLRSVPK
jgi:hypothetical protein